jgi:predicted RNA-binding protein
VRRSGLFFFGSAGLSRPEVVHYRNQLRRNFRSPEIAKTILLVPQTRSKPFHKAKEFQKIKQILQRIDPKCAKKVHVCVYEAPFGVVPMDLDEVYPLSQHEAAMPLEKDTIDYVAEQVADYIKRSECSSVVLLHDPKNWSNNVKNAVIKACLAKKLSFEHLNLNVKRQKTILTRLEIILTKPSE